MYGGKSDRKEGMGVVAEGFGASVRGEIHTVYILLVAAGSPVVNFDIARQLVCWLLQGASFQFWK